METLTMPEFITVPRSALQALAEAAEPFFAWGRIRAKLPAQHPRWTSWNIHDDLEQALEGERLAFLRDIFWRAYNAAIERERVVDPARGYGGSPSLELFTECLAELDDSHWDEPLPPKVVAKRKRVIRAKNAEKARWMAELEQPTPETQSDSMSMAGDIALSLIRKNLASENPEVRASAQDEIPRLMAELAQLLDTAQAVA